MTPLYLSSKAVEACLPPDEIYATVERTMRSLGSPGVMMGPHTHFAVEHDGDRSSMGSMSGAVLAQDAVGFKWYATPGKGRRPELPRAPATMLVLNASTGLLDGVVDATHLNSERTAAMGIVAAWACARRPVKTAAVIGAGHIGRAVVKHLVNQHAVERVAIGSRTEASAHEACEMVVPQLTRKTDLRPTTDLHEAVRDADVVITATAASQHVDLVRAQWLKPGAIVCSLNSWREVHLDVVQRSWIVLSDLELFKPRRPDLCEGGEGWARIAGDVASLMAGKLELPPPATTIYMLVSSMGVLDVALGARALANARAKGIGISL